MLELKVNVSEEVDEKQFNFLTKNFKGLIAWRKQGGKFYVKLLVGQYRDLILKTIQ